VTSQISIRTEEFREFSQFLEKSCGILLAEHKQYLVQSRLGRIMRDNNLTSLHELTAKLNGFSGNSLKEKVINAMTTNETLWFRDVHPFEILTKTILPELTENARGSRLRVWSAACSTGQEPYSISMVLDEFKKANPGKLSSEEIVATDISTEALNAARSGEYEMLAIGRGLSQDRLKKYFSQTATGGWKVNPDIQRRVRFQSLNLMGSYAALGQFDVIFIRNVLIYFSAEMKADILRKMHKQMRKGAYLMLGASESMSGLNDCFELIHCRPGIIYKAK